MSRNAVRFALIAALAVTAAGCSRSRTVDVTAAPDSETVSDVAGSEAPAASDAASDAKAVVRDASDTPARAQGQDLDPDEVAAAGDTSRRVSPSSDGEQH